MASDTNKGCVLLVDDEDAIRESLGELLEACGFVTHRANCVDNAIKLLDKQFDVEAIVSDMKMPGKTGIDLLHYLNEHDRKIPVIFLTGYGTLETCQEAVRSGAFDYILKPLDDKDKVLMPLSHAVALVRPLMHHTVPGGIALHVGVLALYASAGFYIALALTRRRLLR